MKVSTHIRMTIDVLRDWQDELGIDLDDPRTRWIIQDIVQRANAFVDMRKFWRWQTKDGEEFPIPHHRWRSHEEKTAIIIRFHALSAREIWLKYREEMGEKPRVGSKDFSEFVWHLAAAMHLIQDFTMWGYASLKGIHDQVEDTIDRVYKPLRKKFESRKNFHERYWDLKQDNCDWNQNNTSDYYKYCCGILAKESYKRSSELVAWVLSDRQMSEEEARYFIDKYGEVMPEVPEEFDYWKRYGVPFVTVLLVLFFYIFYKRSMITIPSEISPYKYLYDSIMYLIAFIMLVGGVVCKIFEFVKGRKKFDVYPDGARYLVRWEPYRTLTRSVEDMIDHEKERKILRKLSPSGDVAFR